MIQKIVLIGDPILTQVAEPVHITDDPTQIIQDLKDTLKSGKMWARGVSLAAPQIGVSKRIILINYGKFENLVLINPKIMEASGRMKQKEMCLSIPGAFKRTVRRQSVTVEYQDENLQTHIRTFAGMDAICIQHEIDHLDGRLISDQKA